MSGHQRPTATAAQAAGADPGDARPPLAASAGRGLNRRHAALAMPLLATLAMATLPPARAATPGDDAPPPAQPPRPLAVPIFHQQVLANGLTVVSAPRTGAPFAPLVSLTLLVRAGAEADPASRAGTAAMTAALLGKGATRHGRTVPATDLARQAEALGGALDSGSGWRASTLGMTVTTPRAEAALALLADVLRRPLLAADELERARAQTLDSLKLAMGDPGQVAALVLRRAYWGDTPYGTVVPPAAVARIRRADVQQFHARWYRPERTVLIVAGDLSAEQAGALAQRLLGDWRVAGPAPAEPAPARVASINAPLVLVDMPGTGQSGVAVAAPFIASDPAGRGDAAGTGASASGASPSSAVANGVSASQQRRIALLANAVLGGGYSARLNQEIRIKRGLSYGAGSAAEAHPGAGMFSASAQTNHPTAAQVLQILRDEVTQLADHPPSADELAARQATLIGAFARRLETNGGLASLVQGQLVQGRPLDELNRYAQDVLAVTPQQVSDFARSHWTAGRLRAVIAGDLGAAGDSLKALGDGALRLTLAELDLEQPGLRRR